MLHEIMLYCKIQPLQRPRFNRKNGNVFQPKDNQKELMFEMDLYRKETPIECAVIVDTAISFEKRKGHDWPTLKTYGDEDNLRKAINDALQDKNILADDKYVIGGENVKFFGGENYCHIKIWEARIDTTRIPRDCG